MEDANDTKLETFHRWYEQAGTPSVDVVCSYDEAAKVRASPTPSPRPLCPP